MTDLTLFYGTMESGKTTKLLQDNYNYRKHGHKVLIIKPLIDLKGGNTVVNRTNEFAPVDILLANDESIFDDKYLPLIKGTELLSCIFSFEFWMQLFRFQFPTESTAGALCCPPTKTTAEPLSYILLPPPPTLCPPTLNGCG